MTATEVLLGCEGAGRAPELVAWSTQTISGGPLHYKSFRTVYSAIDPPLGKGVSRQGRRRSLSAWQEESSWQGSQASAEDLLEPPALAVWRISGL